MFNPKVIWTCSSVVKGEHVAKTFFSKNALWGYILERFIDWLAKRGQICICKIIITHSVTVLAKICYPFVELLI